MHINGCHLCCIATLTTCFTCIFTNLTPVHVCNLQLVFTNTLTLSVIQDTIGVGIPDTLQIRVTLSPSVTFLSSIACMEEGTKLQGKVKVTNKYTKSKNKHAFQTYIGPYPCTMYS